MKFLGKVVNEKGITLIILIAVILILIALISITFKGVFNSQSIGASEIKEESQKDLIRKICRIYPSEKYIYKYKKGVFRNK